MKNNEKSSKKLIKITNQTIVISGAIINILLFGIKLIIGITINSVAIMTDAFNNLSDAFTNILVAIGIKLAIKPADSLHPFGHGRFEYLTALIVSCIIIFLGFEFFVISLREAINPQYIHFNFLLFAILMLTAMIKICMYLFYKKSSSSSILALAIDNRNDAITTIFATFSILFTSLTNIVVDGFVGMIISFIILYSGVKLAKGTISKLLGEAIDKETEANIKILVESNEHVLGTHDLIVHNYGKQSIMATLHVDLPNTLMLDQAHQIIDEIERNVKQTLGINLLIHVDPISVRDKRIHEIKQKVLNYIRDINSELDAHDFKIKDGNTIDIIFELVLPHGFTKDKEDMLIISLQAIIKSLDKRYNAIVEPKYKYTRD